MSSFYISSAASFSAEIVLVVVSSCWLWHSADPLFSQLLAYKHLLMRFWFSLQFDPTESYQPASLQLIKEALKMHTPSKNLQAASRPQSEGNVVKGSRNANAPWSQSSSLLFALVAAILECCM